MIDTKKFCGLIIIGHEILSGRTQDANIQFLAKKLSALGIPLEEVRIVPDREEAIIKAVNEMRSLYRHVFTTGGIGPTHDDITSPSLAKAFGKSWVLHKEAVALMTHYYKRKGLDFNESRKRMVTMPEGAVLIKNSVSAAPGFSIGNVHVMAGVPRIMQAMFQELEPFLGQGQPVFSLSVYSINILEGDIASELKKIQAEFPHTDIGSYPFKKKNKQGLTLLVKGTSEKDVTTAYKKMKNLLTKAGGNVTEGEPDF